MAGVGTSGTTTWVGPETARSQNEHGLSAQELVAALHDVHARLLVQRHRTGTSVVRADDTAGAPGAVDAGHLLGVVPALSPRVLGDESFCRDYQIDYPYVSGSMAAGIASESIVEAMAGANLLGFFGAAGLSLARVEQALDRLQRSVGNRPFGCNFIHSPNEPQLERGLCELYLRRGVRLIEASAFLDLTPQLIRYRFQGVHRAADGTIVTPNRVIAKVSRVEVATRFFSPPAARLLSSLVEAGELSAQEAELAAQLPVAQDLTAEADSGGHTDNRPLVSLLPTLLALRDRLQPTFGDRVRLRVGAAGGIATPASTYAAFAMGAAYVLTGSVQQACVESGTCDVVRKLLAEAEQADCVMCPAADMFEMGVKLQVLKRGTMFAMRATRLYELYRACASIDDIPAGERAQLEKTVFQLPLEEVWRQTAAYFATRDPAQIERAERDPKHKMALVFRWYLGQSSRWANLGDPARRLDYQIWCGPAMGAFNEWTRGTFLAEPSERRVVAVAGNLLYGAAVMARINMLKQFGVDIPASAWRIAPQPQSRLQDQLR